MSKEMYVKSLDEIKLHFKKDGNKARAVLIMTHGIAEHSTFYDEVAQMIAKEDFIVYRYDLRGHGISEGTRGSLRKFKDFINDLDVIVNKAKKENPKRKIILHGHSLGGLISSAYASLYPNKIDFLIASSASNKNPLNSNSIKLFFSFILSRKRFFNKLKEHLTSSPSANDALINDPLVLKFLQVSLLYNAFVKGTRFLRKNIKYIKVPTLVLHGDADKIVDPKIGQWTYDKLRVNDKKIIFYEGFKHEMYFEKNKDILVNDIISWINEKL